MTPAIPPHRCPCQDTPNVPGSAPHRMPPYTRKTMMPTTICHACRVKNPKTIRNVNQPKIRPGGPDVVGLHSVGRAQIADQPGAKAAENPHDDGGVDEASHPGQRHQEAEHQRGNGVRDQMRPVGVQQGRPEDAPQPVHLERADAVLLKSTSRHLIDGLDDVEQGDEADDGDAADHPGRPLLLRRGERAHGRSRSASRRAPLVLMAALPVRLPHHRGYRRRTR